MGKIERLVTTWNNLKLNIYSETTGQKASDLKDKEIPKWILKELLNIRKYYYNTYKSLKIDINGFLLPP